MWIDESGVAHTVALPQPADVMSDAFRQSLDVLGARSAAAVAEVLEAAEAAVFEEDLEAVLGTGGDAESVGRPPARDLLDGEPATAEELARLLSQVELRWRLDAILALVDYTDAD